MRWTPRGRSADIEDRRGAGGGGLGLGGGGIRLGLGGTLIVLVLSVIFGQDFLSLFSGGAPAPASGSYSSSDRGAGDTREVQFVSFVLDDVQKTWDNVLGQRYRHSTLVLFRDFTQSACGAAQAATGPFYCPGDEKVYIDLGFFDELANRFGAPGEFAQAYVLAHEIGHHVQKVLGIEQAVRQQQMRSPSEQNPLSVKLELQADCLAGVWGHSTFQRDIIDQADVSAGLQAAAAVGDDRLQRMSRDRVSPESFTHGSSEQRMAAFQRGLRSGQIASCNTFE